MKKFFLLFILFIIVNFSQTKNFDLNRCTTTGCCDRNNFCKIWSKLGECKKNPLFMKLNCPMSCSFCDRKSIQEEDLNDIRNSFQKINCPKVETFQESIATEVSPERFQATLSRIGCGVESLVNDCSQSICYHKYFRTFDGSCNNFKHPSWGTATTRYYRLREALYEDGLEIPVGTKKFYRPDPRNVTRYLLNNDKNIFSNFNQLAMQWGQFLAHDILMNGRSNVCECKHFNNPICMNINIDKSDKSKIKMKCIPFSRSIPACRNDSFIRPREQINLNSAFIDGTTIYGSTTSSMNLLRDGHLLKSEHNKDGKEFAPDAITEHGTTMKVGDNRGIIFIGTASLHTIFLRYHNLVANQLKEINSHWTDDRIFQETRKIIGGILQSITYNEFLPALLGKDNIDKMIPKYKGYNDSIPPTISNEFSAAAFRLHGMVVKYYPFININNKVIGNIKFIEGTLTLKQILERGAAPLFRGLIATPLRKPQRITSQITEEFMDGIGDLSTINIQRGRDHGLRNYNDYREYCGMEAVNDFLEWEEVSDVEVKKRALELYKHPDNMELYVGGLLEEPIKEGILGPTFSCIIADQFKRLRDGDRFFYKNRGIFNRLQKKSLNLMTISSIICATEPEIKNIPLFAFLTDNGEKAIPCAMIPQLNITLWKSNN
uniref:peroxidase n=1 Tax=Parastrongyloides trichosuri TaxID=131310 RepID=A0A0N4ZCA1_PARTI